VLKAIPCARFTGYKPCRGGFVCRGESCPEFRRVAHTTLLVNLDNLGNVIQTTAVLPALRRSLPDTHLTWVTASSAVPVLLENPLIDRVMPYDFETVSVLGAMEFDLVLNVDKTRRSAALASSIRAKEKRGFGLSALGAIEPFNREAEYWYDLGLDDDLKFRRNRLPGTRIATEALGFEWRRDPYVVVLSDSEKAFVREYRSRLGPGPVVGLNTGSSPQFPNKSLSARQFVELVRRLARRLPGATILLLGGPHETEKNAEIARATRGRALETPTSEGPRRGLLYVDACDVVVTGDTSGLHMAIALGKWVVAHFGVTCAVEIDLYDRGVAIASPLDCSPCWRQSCPRPRCVEELDLELLVEGVLRGVPTRTAGGRSRRSPRRS